MDARDHLGKLVLGTLAHQCDDICARNHCGALRERHTSMAAVPPHRLAFLQKADLHRVAGNCFFSASNEVSCQGRNTAGANGQRVTDDARGTVDDAPSVRSTARSSATTRIADAPVAAENLAEVMAAELM